MKSSNDSEFEKGILKGLTNFKEVEITEKTDLKQRAHDFLKKREGSGGGFIKEIDKQTKARLSKNRTYEKQREMFRDQILKDRAYYSKDNRPRKDFELLRRDGEPLVNLTDDQFDKLNTVQKHLDLVESQNFFADNDDYEEKNVDESNRSNKFSNYRPGMGEDQILDYDAESPHYQSENYPYESDEIQENLPYEFKEEIVENADQHINMPSSNRNVQNKWGNPIKVQRNYDVGTDPRQNTNVFTQNQTNVNLNSDIGETQIFESTMNYNQNSEFPIQKPEYFNSTVRYNDNKLKKILNFKYNGIFQNLKYNIYAKKCLIYAIFDQI